MVEVIQTDDREQFERDLLAPGRFARLLERAGRYLDGLDAKEVFLEAALDYMWDQRSRVKDTSDLLRKWDEALDAAAHTRARWLVHYGAALERQKWVRSDRLGRR